MIYLFGYEVCFWSVTWRNMRYRISALQRQIIVPVASAGNKITKHKPVCTLNIWFCIAPGVTVRLLLKFIRSAAVPKFVSKIIQWRSWYMFSSIPMCVFVMSDRRLRIRCLSICVVYLFIFKKRCFDFKSEILMLDTRTMNDRW